MNEKKTEDLEKVLGNTHIDDFEGYISENEDSIITSEEDFYIYIKDLLHQKNISQQLTFLKADIPEKYGYKLLSGEKRTRQRDVILRICYAAELTLEETQRALKKYGLPELYAKVPRDAFLMVVFNDRPGSVIDVNSLLKEKGFDTLRTSGAQD
jgi:hypothetical protein